MDPGELDIPSWVQPEARSTRSPACPRSLAWGKLEVKGSKYIWALAGEAQGTRTGARQHCLGRPGTFPAAGARWAGRGNSGGRGGGSIGRRGACGGGQAGRERPKFFGPDGGTRAGRGLWDPRVGGVRSPETQRGPRPPFPAGRGRVPPARPPTHALPGFSPSAATQTRPQAPGCVWGTFQTQGFQSHTEKGSEEVFALNSNKGQHARRFGRNSIIVINN